MLNYLLICLLSVVICYLIGGIMFGIIVSKLAKHDDVRKYGSGNAGATNMLRVFGIKAGIVTFVLDVVKCLAAILLCKYLLILPFSQGLDHNVFTHPDSVIYYCGFATLFGHSSPVFFKFKGGKAAAGAVGVMLCLNWQVALAVLVVFTVVAVLTRIVSLGSILGAVVYIILNFFTSVSYEPLPRLYIVLLGALVGGLVIIRHKENISRLMKGEEKPISLKSKQGK